MTKIINLIFVVVFTILSLSCEKNDTTPTGGALIVENNVNFPGPLKITVYIDNTNHGTINFGDTKTYTVNDGSHDLHIEAAPNQGAIWSVNGTFEVHGGGIVSIQVTEDGF